MRVLIFGANGQVGSALKTRLSLVGHQILALGRSDRGGDVVDFPNVEAAIQAFQPDVIVNAAAFTNVDMAESQPSLAFDVNERAVANLARCAKAYAALLIHFGTDFVFDGSGHGTWQENDEPNPINVYGLSKLAGEQAIVQSGCRHVILRVSWVHAARHKNFITSSLQWLKANPCVRIVNDQWGAPTSAVDVANAVQAIIDRTMNRSDLDGIYHFANSGCVTRFDCVRFIASLLPSNDGQRIVPVDSSTFDLPARRPLNCRLETQKFKETFGFEPRSWQEGVKETVLGSM